MIHICRPRTVLVRRVLRCPTCRRRRRCVMSVPASPLLLPDRDVLHVRGAVVRAIVALLRGERDDLTLGEASGEAGVCRCPIDPTSQTQETTSEPR